MCCKLWSANLIVFIKEQAWERWAVVWWYGGLTRMRIRRTSFPRIGRVPSGATLWILRTVPPARALDASRKVCRIMVQPVPVYMTVSQCLTICLFSYVCLSLSVHLIDKLPLLVLLAVLVWLYSFFGYLIYLFSLTIRVNIKPVCLAVIDCNVHFAGQESMLVAVIPCSDQRLDPRHT